MSGSGIDRSNGWEAIAPQFIATRNSHIGVATLEAWSGLLPANAAVLDLGCGFGVPYTKLLLDAGFEVYGIDAAPSLIGEFQRRFDAITAIGLHFDFIRS